MRSGLRADIRRVSRTSLALVMIIAGLGVATWKSMIVVPALERARGGDGTNVIAEGAAFGQASSELAAYARIAGTFAGGELSPMLPLRLAWANERGYCLQGATLYLIGPAGVAQPGACPAG